MATSRPPSHALPSSHRKKSSEMLTPFHSPRDIASPAHHRHATKSQRVLACVLCQQRKVRCDRIFPCANCTKAGVQCLPAAQTTRQRRRRFPERDLLDRLRHYENLLRQHSIQFEPLHSPEFSTEACDVMSTDTHGATALEPPTMPNSDPSIANYKASNFWHALNQKSQKSDNDDRDGEADGDEVDDDSDSPGYLIREKTVKRAWDTLYDNSDHLFFCSGNPEVDVSALHPNHIHIFKLWQVYLENFDPLLKVTHAPSLQARIIDAASDVTNIEAPLQALMFSIYCVAIFSLDQKECQELFQSPRDELLSKYQLGAKEALLNCRFLRTDNRECLTAFHLYLMTTKTFTDPRALSAVLGTAIRIAQRMGLHDESINRKHNALEAELRRRLWWSLILFDARISEMTDFRLGLLLPTWDCKPPLNVNDFDLRLGMKTAPEVHGVTSEALFVVVRSEFNDFIRHCSFHLDFINPALKTVARRDSSSAGSNADELAVLEQLLEEKYLRHCDPQNPLHFMTIWWARGQLAKSRFVRYLSERSKTTVQPTNVQRDEGIMYALAMLRYDTKIMSSKHCKGFHWLIYLNFPFPAYVHIVQDLRMRPLSEHASIAWNVMSENCAIRFLDVDGRDKFMDKKDNPFFKIFATVIFQAWAAREAALIAMDSEEREPPRIITQIKARMARIDAELKEKEGVRHSNGEQLVAENSSVSPSIDLALASYNMEQHLVGAEHGVFQPLQEQPWMGFGVQAWGWPAENFHPMLGHGW